MIRRLHASSVGLIVGSMSREHVKGTAEEPSATDDPTSVGLIRWTNDVSITSAEGAKSSGSDDPTPRWINASDDLMPTTSAVRRPNGYPRTQSGRMIQRLWTEHRRIIRRPMQKKD